MTNRELSQVIRKDLKEHGITSKDVSVRVRDALYDTSVNITIKNPLIRETDVESITRKYSKVDYDQRSMEILAGCNVYVHCEYAYGLFDDVSAPLIPIAELLFVQLIGFPVTLLTASASPLHAISKISFAYFSLFFISSTSLNNFNVPVNSICNIKISTILIHITSVCQCQKVAHL